MEELASVAIGSPAMSEQYNYLVSEIQRIRHDCPCVSTFSYCGEIGLTTNNKNLEEYSTSTVVPVESVVSECDATCHVLLGAVMYSGAADLYLPASQLSWKVYIRAAYGTVGTYDQETVPTAWTNVAAGFGGRLNVVSAPVSIGASSSYRYLGAIVALRLTGTWGYSGNIPGFAAFCSY